MKVQMWALLVAGLVGVGLLACDRSPDDQNEAPASLTPKSNELPPLELRDDTTDLLLTWIDEKGDFHVSMKIAEVPAERREQVRVVVTTRKEGTGQLFYVADLRQPGPSGTYPVRTMTRAQWDEIGASRRKARLEALAPSAQPSAPAPTAAASAGRPGEPKDRGHVVAVIYGAEWCKPCHAAARYLKRLGVTVVEKNIEEDQLAAREMQTKLRRARLPSTASIPVIDVGGQLLVGFNPPALQQAVKSARSAKPL